MRASPPSGDSPLLHSLFDAAEKNDLDDMKALIDQGVPVNGTATSGHYTYTLLTDVADAGNVEALKYLITRGANPDLADNEGSTPLLHACSTDHTDCALALLDAGANPNLASEAGRCPLMYASQKGNDTVVAALLAHHADVNASNSCGPAIWWAAGDRHFSTLRLLVNAGANLRLPSQDTGFPGRLAMALLSFPTSEGDISTMDFLLKHGDDINETAPDGSTPLMIAAINNRLAALQWLIAKGARLDQQNSMGLTALMAGSMYRNRDAVQILLDSGAKLDLQDKKGRTALMWAAREAATDVGSLLINQGADINLADPQGETALTFAGNVGKTELVDLLKSKGARRTDLHIICDTEPAHPLPPPKAWALGVCAIYTQLNGYNHKILGGNPPNSDASIQMLRDYWGITNREGLLREVNELQTFGHHTGYQREGARLASLGYLSLHFDLLCVWLFDFLDSRPDGTPRVLKMRDLYLKWGKQTALAWDLCRAANLVNNGYASNYIGEDEAWQLMKPIAQRTQASFGSWQEMNENFLDGREIWAGKRDPTFEAGAQLLLNPHDPNSPWNQNAWKTDLSTF